MYKGPDCVSVEVRPTSNYDEVQQYVDARWICAPEAFWKIFNFAIYQMYPSVEHLQIHLPNTHRVRFRRDQMIAEVLDNKQNKKTMLIEFFYRIPLIQKQGTIYTENSLSIIVGLVVPKYGDKKNLIKR